MPLRASMLRPMFSLALSMFLMASTPRCEEVVLPSVTAIDHCDRIEHSASFPRCTFEDARTTERVNEIVERRVREEADYDAALKRLPEPEDGECIDPTMGRARPLEASCEVPYRVSNVVSYACRSAWEGAHPDGAPWSINIELGPRIRELELRDLLVSAASEARLWRLVRANLRRQIEDAYADGERDQDWTNQQLASASTAYQAINLTDRGLVVSYDHYAFGYAVLDATISYRALRGILLPKLLPRRRSNAPL